MRWWETCLAALAGGLLSGIWWPANPLAGGVAGLLGALCYAGLKAELREFKDG